MKQLIAWCTLVGVVGTVGCSSSTPVSPSGVVTASPSGPTLVDVAVGNPDFSTLVAALQRADLVASFAGAQRYTVFAPTNAAFDAAAAALLGPGTTGLDLVNGLDLDTLKAVLLYHVTLGSQKAADVLAAGSLPMMDGNRTTIAVTGGTPTIDGAAIVATDVEASNGIIHVIGSVLLPPSLR